MLCRRHAPPLARRPRRRRVRVRRVVRRGGHPALEVQSGLRGREDLPGALLGLPHADRRRHPGLGDQPERPRVQGRPELRPPQGAEGPGPVRDRERRLLVGADAAGHRRRRGGREGRGLRREVLGQARTCRIVPLGSTPELDASALPPAAAVRRLCSTSRRSARTRTRCARRSRAAATARTRCWTACSSSTRGGASCCPRSRGSGRSRTPPRRRSPRPSRPARTRAARSRRCRRSRAAARRCARSSTASRPSSTRRSPRSRTRPTRPRPTRTRCSTSAAKPAARARTTSSSPARWIDMEAGARVAGSRFAYLKGDLVLLELALVRWVLELLRGKGFEPVVPPVLVREEALYGTGFLPDTEQQIYRLADDPLYLAGTSEVPLASLHAGEILDDAAAALRRVLAVLPARGGRGGARHARPVPRAPVRQGRDVLVRGARGRRGRARAAARQRGGDPHRARDPLPRRQHRGRPTSAPRPPRSTTARRGCRASSATAS